MNDVAHHGHALEKRQIDTSVCVNILRRDAATVASSGELRGGCRNREFVSAQFLGDQT